MTGRSRFPYKRSPGISDGIGSVDLNVENDTSLTFSSRKRDGFVELNEGRGFADVFSKLTGSAFGTRLSGA